ncbi:hypothetical protein [Nonomuraea dietziae]|uniref:hypothetical protein n=1 Tax=Nonomuraea dietziae TaxID=65515 RepID=UPI0031D8BA8B
MTVTLTSPASVSRRQVKVRRRPDQVRSRLAAWIAVVVIGLFGMLPVYWLVATAFTPDDKAFSFPPSLFPTEITFDHFANLAGTSSCSATW